MENTGIMKKIEEFFAYIGRFFANIAKKLHISQDTIIDIGLYGGIGVLVGFLFRRLSGYVLLIILGIIGLFVLSHYNIITLTVNMEELHRILGIQEISLEDGTTFQYAWQWVKANAVIASSFGIGFLFGLHIG